MLEYLIGDSYETEKSVRVKDVKLRCVYLFFFVLAFIYVVAIQIILEHRYAIYESPVGYSNMWATGLLPNTVVNGTSTFCNNNLYDWGDDHTPEEQAVTSGIFVANATCRPFDLSRDAIVSTSSISFVTYEGLYERVNGSLVPISDTFIDGVDAAVFNQIHSYSVSWLDQAVVNPPTTIYDSDGKVFKQTEDGDILGGISVGDWVKLAGGDLDSRNVQPWLRAGQLEEQPFFRFTGIVVLMRVAYTNLHNFEPPVSRPRGSIVLESLPNAWGYLGFDEYYDERYGKTLVRQRNGVVLQLLHTGTIGTPSLFAVVLRLIEALVLFKFAHLLTEYFAKGVPCVPLWLVRCAAPKKSNRLKDTEGSLVGLINALLPHCCEGFADHAETFRQETVESVVMKESINRIKTARSSVVQPVLS